MRPRSAEYSRCARAFARRPARRSRRRAAARAGGDPRGAAAPFLQTRLMLAGNLPHEEEQTMAEPQMVDPHDVVMTGENSFIRLSNDGGKTITDRVSHWRVLWSPAGQGHALFVESPLSGDGPVIYADNAGIVRYLQRTIEVLLHKPFADELLPIIDAEFTRTG